MFKSLCAALAICLALTISVPSHAFVKQTKCKGKPCFLVSEKSARKTVGILMQFDSMGNTVKLLKKDKKKLEEKVKTLQNKNTALNKQLAAKSKEAEILRSTKDSKPKTLIEQPMFWVGVVGALIGGVGIGILVKGLVK